MKTGQYMKNSDPGGNKVFLGADEYIRKKSGSATVEAAIVMPLVILAFISVLSVIRIVSIYSRVQHALNQVASELAQYSYIYAVTGLKEQHDEISDDIKKAGEELKAQTEAIITFYNSVESFSADVSSFWKEDRHVFNSLLNTISEFENIQESSVEIVETVNEIMKDPVQEIRMIGLALSDSLLSKSKTVLFTAIAKNMLKNKLSGDLKVDTKNLDKVLLIKGEMEKLDFSASSFFNDGETIDIIVEYTVKPGIFIIPEVRLRNRACMLAWTWGVDRELIPDNKFDGISLWNIDKEKNLTSQHLARGNKIEKLFASELKKNMGEHAEITPDNFKTIDLIEYAHNGKSGSLIMIFSLNPFLPTYRSKSAVTGIIKQNLNKLSTFERVETRDFIIDVTLLSGNYKRIAYIIVPENELLPEPYMQAFEECRRLAWKMGIELVQVRKYGEYDYAGEND